MRKRTWTIIISILLTTVMMGCTAEKPVNGEPEKDIIIEESKDEVVEEDKDEEIEQQEAEDEEKEEEKEEETSKQDKIAYPLKLWYSSGAGAWGSSITIYEDGRFFGSYSDSDMGDIGEEYPNGTCYISNFRGKFSSLVKVGDYAYSLTLETITFEQEIGKVYIEDGIRYICTNAAGLTGSDGRETAKNFMLYTPGMPLNSLPEDFLMWWGGYHESPNTKVLPVYGLRNMETNDGYFN